LALLLRKDGHHRRCGGHRCDQGQRARVPHGTSWLVGVSVLRYREDAKLRPCHRSDRPGAGGARPRAGEEDVDQREALRNNLAAQWPAQTLSLARESRFERWRTRVSTHVLSAPSWFSGKASTCFSARRY